ncbi:helix-turn-helix domain-containing protein [Actinomadura sp. NEAU-AAG5]|uniref:Helix-turn-helix domain-containing protein n=1 Tax=Actinomadura litoris TaxID=2678616 RepID=A0A7K1LBT7_9ACTN|nr:helix-turn-helix domain-containing protein [Actinomadura litoris]
MAALRKAQGMKQAGLATSSGYSLSMVTKVESGHTPATPGFISAAARALKVDIAQITGQPYAPDSPTDAQMHEHVAVLRRELSAYNLPPTHDRAPKSLDELRAAVADLAQLRHGVNLLTLGEILPGLLQDLRMAAHTYQSRLQEQVYGLLAETYAAAGQLAYKMGYIDLSSLTTDRYEWVAERSGDPLAVHVGEYLRAGELMVAGDCSSAAALMDASLGRLEPHLATAQQQERPRVWSVWGNLHLKAALVAARSGQPDAELATWQYYGHAEQAAQIVGVDRDDYRLYFGPTNVAIWGVSLAVELCDDAAALNRADNVHLPESAPRERSSHHWIDVSRAHAWRGDAQAALQCLYQARSISPQHTRFHPQVRETMQMIGRTERQAKGTVRGFAHWLGLRD